MSENPFLPIKINSDITASIDKSVKTIILDTKVFKREENKECDFGVLKKKKFIFECGGENPSIIRELIDPDSKIKNLKKLQESGHISQEQYTQKVDEILKGY